MKELSIEEKAKRYDEAIERAKEMIKVMTNIGGVTKVDDIQYLLPELKESEDEKIGKALIDYFRWNPNSQLLNEFTNREVFAWLEKQDEQKVSVDDFKAKGWYVSKVDGKIHNICYLSDNIEPKFKVGDWVVWDNKIFCHIDNIYQGKESLMYTITDVHNMTRSYSVKGFDNNSHLWTIQDAKEGDVLVCPKYAGDIIPNIFIFKNINIKDNDVYCYCSFLETFRTEGYIANADPINTDFYPATKEQRDLLFQKMKEAGYEWDAEKKELKKIEQKSAWSEEDENKLNEILHDIECSRAVHLHSPKQTFDSRKNWLKSLKDRVQPKQEWSEEDEELMKWSIINLTELKDRFGEGYGNVGKCIDWLKSLRPQNTWKPSDEQMIAIQEAMNIVGILTITGSKINSLYQDLKKLKAGKL